MRMRRSRRRRRKRSRSKIITLLLSKNKTLNKVFHKVFIGKNPDYSMEAFNAIT